jgi:hypothetical protein
MAITLKAAVLVLGLAVSTLVYTGVFVIVFDGLLISMGC